MPAELAPAELVELSGPFTARGAQQVGCGHVVRQGEALYELHSATGAVGSLCAVCVHDVAERCSVIDTPVW